MSTLFASLGAIAIAVGLLGALAALDDISRRDAVVLAVSAVIFGAGARLLAYAAGA